MLDRKWGKPYRFCWRWFPIVWWRPPGPSGSAWWCRNSPVRRPPPGLVVLSGPHGTSWPSVSPTKSYIEINKKSFPNHFNTLIYSDFHEIKNCIQRAKWILHLLFCNNSFYFLAMPLLGFSYIFQLSIIKHYTYRMFLLFVSPVYKYGADSDCLSTSVLSPALNS